MSYQYKRIVKVLDHVTQLPNRKPHHYKVEVMGSDNKTYETTIHETEYNLWKYFLEHPQKVDVDKMAELIEDYGQYCYEKGEFESNENEDL